MPEKIYSTVDTDKRIEKKYGIDMLEKLKDDRRAVIKLKCLDCGFKDTAKYVNMIRNDKLCKNPGCPHPLGTYTEEEDKRVKQLIAKRRAKREKRSKKADDSDSSEKSIEEKVVKKSSKNTPKRQSRIVETESDEESVTQNKSSKKVSIVEDPDPERKSKSKNSKSSKSIRTTVPENMDADARARWVDELTWNEAVDLLKLLGKYFGDKAEIKLKIS